MGENKNTGGVFSKLKVAIVLTLVILFIEIIGGFISGSLALFSDAGHVFMDITALVLSFGALSIAMRPSTHDATFGHHRVEIVVALVNAVILFFLSLFILYNAYLRFSDPPEVKSTEMLVVAVIGFSVNLYVAWNLHGYHDLNVRSAYLHVFGDLIASVAVIIGAIIIGLTGQFWVDPAASVLIAIIIISRCLRLMKESGDILLEKTPKHINLDNLKSDIMKLDGVDDIHDLHVWSICSNVHAIACHIVVKPERLQESSDLIRKMNTLVSEGYQIGHATFQVECGECDATCELPHIEGH
jgi:cobalt-zinc-cadmium efflux system protein